MDDYISRMRGLIPEGTSNSSMKQKFYALDSTDNTRKWFDDVTNTSITPGSVSQVAQYGDTGDLLGAYAGGEGFTSPAAWTAENGFADGLGSTENGIGDWFSNNKDMLGVGLGLGQLGLGYLNYSANKDALDSQLASEAQTRDLLATAQTNRENISNKAKSALRWS